ncbi:WGR domain-containing protein [Cereibacter sphaeroides]|uniref:WGR domain-containing protein n=1 Tax=Cereibacter sphaeroides TaxID=1063 RepID=UPI001F3D39DC|nr:WGR domain-containing protein [Cereibacter sphaeroides]MCE6959268.1 WGR domain-containing protein [Cereibacter sphaeroides]MCE6972860.1 WGR domain-containing protein [Cereibacter sphaeroides]
MDIYLEKIEPDRNCFRFYAIRIEPDFFAEASLVVQWGRIGRAGRIWVRGSGTLRDVEDMGRKILKLRLRHGYQPRRAGQEIEAEVLEDPGRPAPAAPPSRKRSPVRSGKPHR